MKTYRCLAILFFLISASTIFSQNKQLIIDSLIVINLEEDKSAINKRDEILLIYGNYNNDDFKVSKYKTSPILEFSDSLVIQKVFNTFSLKQDEEFFIGLIEVDTDLSNTTISELFIDGLESSINFPYQLCKDKVNQSLEDDDLLGLLFFDLKELEEENKLVFKGRHLFNKFEYQVYLRVN